MGYYNDTFFGQVAVKPLFFRARQYLPTCPLLLQSTKSYTEMKLCLISRSGFSSHQELLVALWERYSSNWGLHLVPADMCENVLVLIWNRQSLVLGQGWPPSKLSVRTALAASSALESTDGVVFLVLFQQLRYVAEQSYQNRGGPSVTRIGS